MGSILAVVFGHTALRQIDQARGAQSGRGMAVAGAVLGWLGVALSALLLATSMGIVGDDSSPECDRALSRADQVQNQQIDTSSLSAIETHRRRLETIQNQIEEHC